ncbi:hypothetical protein [Nonomuraea longicatena]
MGALRMVVAYGLGAVSVAAIAWLTVIARPVEIHPPPDPVSPRALPSLSPFPDRTVTTDVTVARAARDTLTGVPSARIDDRQYQARVTITHTIRMAEDDALAAWIRQGNDFPTGIRTLVDDGLGRISVGGSWLAPTVRLPPTLTTRDGRTTARFRVIVLRQLSAGTELDLDFQTPKAQPVALRRTVTLRPTEWTVLRTTGLQPERETPDRLRFTTGEQVRLWLVHRSHGFADEQPMDPFAWGTALAIGTTVVLVFFLLRSLGTAWWAQLPNRELAIGLLLVAPALLVPMLTQSVESIGYVIMFGALPVLALRHASRMVPVPAPWTTRDVLAVTALGVLVALGMLIWSGRQGQLPYPELVAGAMVVALSAATAAIVFSADLGVRNVVVRLAAVSAGAALGCLALALWARALAHGVYPPDSVRLVLGLFWSLIPIGAIAVVTRTWSRPVVAVALLVGLLMQGWPAEWLDDGSWSVDPASQANPRVGDRELTELLRGVFGLLLLGFVLLVVRLRRLGQGLPAVHNRAAVSITIVLLMVLYLSPRGTGNLPDLNVSVPLLSITSLVAWVTAWWLLGPPDPDLVEPATIDEHRDLVRSALHKRLLLISEQELYRVGRGKIGAGELSMTDFEQQRGDLETALDRHGRHPETAFATAAACSPWHNGLQGFVVCLLLSLPLGLVYGAPAGTDLASYLFDARYLLTLPAFGFLFGYFYPRLRGTQPMTKVLHLMAAAVLTELSAYLPAFVEPDVALLEKVQLVAIVVGQAALVYIGLGLFWEWRIMRLAGEPWGRVRNVRSLRSLATPLVAVIIAVGTAAASAAATHTVDRLLRGEQVTSAQK